MLLWSAVSNRHLLAFLPVFGVAYYLVVNCHFEEWFTINAVNANVMVPVLAAINLGSVVLETGEGNVSTCVCLSLGFLSHTSFWQLE